MTRLALIQKSKVLNPSQYSQNRLNLLRHWKTQDNDEDVLGAEVNSMLDDVLHARSSSAKLLAKESEFDSIFNNAR